MRKEPLGSKAAAQGARGPALFEGFATGLRTLRMAIRLECSTFVFPTELGVFGTFGLSHGTRVGADGVRGA